MIPERSPSAYKARSVCARDGDMNVKFREITHVSPAALANFMKFQPLFWLGKFHYEFHEMDARAKPPPQVGRPAGVPIKKRRTGGEVLDSGHRECDVGASRE